MNRIVLHSRNANSFRLEYKNISTETHYDAVAYRAISDYLAYRYFDAYAEMRQYNHCSSDDIRLALNNLIQEHKNFEVHNDRT